MAISPRTDNNKISVATAADDGASELWRVSADGSRGSLTATFTAVSPSAAGGSEVRWCAFTGDGQRLLVITDDCAVVWDVSHIDSTDATSYASECIFDFNDDAHDSLCDTFDPARAAMSTDGRIVMLVKGSVPVLLRDTPFLCGGAPGAGKGKEMAMAKEPASVAWGALSPDGGLLLLAESAVGAPEGTSALRLFDSSTQQPVFTTTVPTAVSCAFSGDGRRIATSHSDGTLRLFLLLTPSGCRGAAPLLHLDLVVQAHPGFPLLSCAFSADSELAVTTSSDQTARIFDTARGSLLVVLRGHADQVEHAQFTADGRLIGTCSRDGAVCVWKSPAVASAISPRGLKVAPATSALAVPAETPRHAAVVASCGPVLQRVFARVTEPVRCPVGEFVWSVQPPLASEGEEVMRCTIHPSPRRSFISVRVDLNGTKERRVAAVALFIDGQQRALGASVATTPGDNVLLPLTLAHEMEQDSGTPITFCVRVSGYALNCCGPSALPRSGDAAASPALFAGAWASSLVVEESELIKHHSS
eukprot:TRINITY_DN4666_c0_g1_i1.p1 TRINITY_DN4666_c0_g1~~TRINITY_DN4666_c0_g1_i1.p1  ORF type:complete len:572 (+),score=132.53 TRINITY_DN4666_c0_g1_i1:124-1716(+)